MSDIIERESCRINDNENFISSSKAEHQWFEAYCPLCDWIILWPAEATPENECGGCSGSLQPTTDEQRGRCSLFVNEGADSVAMIFMLDRLPGGRYGWV